MSRGVTIVYVFEASLRGAHYSFEERDTVSKTSGLSSGAYT